LFSTLN